MKFRVRYRLGHHGDFPWAVEYRYRWWPFWYTDDTFYHEEQANERAQKLSTMKLITKIP
jgi:hypothetical protein